MRICLAADGSKNSMDAVKCLIDHADWYRDKPEVELVYVHLPVPSLPGMSRVVSREQIDKYYREEGGAALAKARKALDASDIKYRQHIFVGPIAETIVRHAEKSKCDIIYIGTRGMNAAANLILGSIATKVLHISKVPVLLVK